MADLSGENGEEAHSPVSPSGSESMRRYKSDSSAFATGQHPCTALRNFIVQNFSAFRQNMKDRAEGQGGGLWADVNALKDGEVAQKKEVKKFSNNIFGKIASHRYLEASTMTVILINALSIGYDADYAATNWRPDNLYDGPVQFIIAEIFFAVYFTVELVIRFFAYRRYCMCLTDSWFIFDSALVLMMNLETFILPFAVSGDSPMANLSVLRLLRLLRVSRMAKLMKTFPELMLIVKGLAAAVRAVSWTLVLLMMLLFVGAIIFTNQYHQGLKSDEEVAGQVEEFFGNMGKSMFSLVIMGTLLDDVTNCSNAIRTSRQLMMLFVLIVFIVLSSFMMLNMLLGILVEVVANTAEGEKAKGKNTIVRKEIIETANEIGKETNGLSKDQFMSMSSDPKVLKNMETLGIKVDHFPSLAMLLFESQEGHEKDVVLSGEEMVAMLFNLQPGTEMTFSELASVEKVLFDSRKEMRRRISQLEALMGLPRNKASTIQVESILAVSMQPDSQPTAPRRPEDKVLMKGNTKETDMTNSGSGFNAIPGSDKQQPLVSIELLDKLNGASTADLVDEVCRRMGCEDLETHGVPLNWFDEDMNARLQGLVMNFTS
eukprot:TRINITY_DN103379_c0_g1_i1.p1 TRINITY_DN103379_c0_g1~~TRINITY_DN103379_c0_g1_i1.p1  ORF type:complete len:601 (+),score=105.31 TRINITY_DN103379_c0_g1_i1:162-1964(+)